MGDWFYDVDNLLDITDEEIGGFIGGNKPGSLGIPFEVGCIFSVDNLYNKDWIPDLMKDFSIEGKPKLQASSNLGTAMEEKHGPEKNSDDVSSSSLTSDSDSRSCLGKKSPLISGMHVPVKRRSKRSRTPVWNWASRAISPSASSVTGNGTNTSLSDNSADYNDSDYFASDQAESESSMKSTSTKMGIKKMEDLNWVRTCAHCGVDKTPQWRVGPLGPKTLCNACGVRYKSGRLFPEYRPAASPTFSAEKHSNSHKVVLEMRRQKRIDI